MSNFQIRIEKIIKDMPYDEQVAFLRGVQMGLDESQKLDKKLKEKFNKMSSDLIKKVC